MAIVYTGGTFDLFHPGHANFLKHCYKISNYGKVIVSLNTDKFVEEYRGKKPLFSYDERKAMLENCKSVSYVIPNSGGRNSKPAIESVRPDFIVVGSDWARKDYYAQMGFTQAWLDQKNITLIYIPYTEGISSTALKERLLCNKE